MREKLESMSLAALRELAKGTDLKHVSTMRKADLINALVALSEQEQKANVNTPTEASVPAGKTSREPSSQGRNQARTDRPQRTNAQARQNPGQEPRDHSRLSRPGRENTSRREEHPAREERPAAQPQQREERPVAQPQQREERPAAQPQQREERPAPQLQQRDDRPPADLSSLDSGNRACGVLEVMADGYGFIRSDHYMPGENDVYVAPSQIRRFNLRTGDIVAGNTRIRSQQEKFSALLYISAINGMPPSEAMRRANFEDLTPVFPYERLRMENGTGDVAMRIVDLMSPIGKGQRGMIVSQPKAGKTTLLKAIASAILKNDPKMHLMIMLIDERPEEVTDIREAIVGERVEVLDSTFDEQPEHHIKVAEMGIERARRLVEYGEDVTILLDSITRLARASNLTVTPSGRTLSGGLDPSSLHMPKRFFGAARKMREGGSLTILATALVETGSKMDDVIFEEFKGTGNMELVLDRKLSERRVFPAIDIQKSGTRREDLLLSQEEQEAVYIMRRALNGMKSEEAAENILNMFVHTRNNAELITRVRRQRFI